MTAVWAQFRWQTTFILPRKIIFIYSWSNGWQLRNWWLWCASWLVLFHYLVHINILNPKAVHETGECTEIDTDIKKATTRWLQIHKIMGIPSILKPKVHQIIFFTSNPDSPEKPMKSSFATDTKLQTNSKLIKFSYMISTSDTAETMTTFFLLVKLCQLDIKMIKNVEFQPELLLTKLNWSELIQSIQVSL